MIIIHDLIRSLGGLHDAVLVMFSWRPIEEKLEIEINDMYANFYGLPEYVGPKRISFVFSGVKYLDIQMNMSTPGLRVYEWTSRFMDDGCQQAVIAFSPAGKVVVNYRHAEKVMRTLKKGS